MKFFLFFLFTFFTLNLIAGVSERFNISGISRGLKPYAGGIFSNEFSYQSDGEDIPGTAWPVFDVSGSFVTEKLALLEEIDNTNFWGRAFVFYGDVLARDNIGTESCEFTRISFFRQDKISLVVLFDRDLSEAIGITDPLEGVNRVMYSINNGVLLYVFRPITWIYSSIFPRYVIKGFKRMTDNVEVLVKGGSCLLQARFEDAGIVGLRFLMNTTVGVAGFYDPALHWCDFRKYNDNFGKAFASWGIGRGCFLMLPIMGPTSLRDAFGAIFDYALDPKSYIYGGQWFAKINYAAIYMDEYIRTYESQVDPYSYIRGIWFVTRKIQLKR